MVGIDAPARGMQLWRLRLVDFATKFPRGYRVRARNGRSVLAAHMDWPAISPKAPDIIFPDHGSGPTGGAVAEYCSAGGLYRFSPSPIPQLRMESQNRIKGP